MAVGDTRRALGLLAARYRRDFDLPMIAVGGVQWENYDQGVNRLRVAPKIARALERGQL